MHFHSSHLKSIIAYLWMWQKQVIRALISCLVHPFTERLIWKSQNSETFSLLWTETETALSCSIFMIWSWGFCFGCNNCNVKQDFIFWRQLSQYNIFWQRSGNFLEIWTATTMSSSISQVFLLLLFIWSQTVQNESAECSWIALAVL